MNEDTDILTFHDDLVPALTAGHYRITVDQKVKIGTDSHDLLPQARQDFEARAPQFFIDPSFVHATYPPPGSTGKYDLTLPHIALTRATLPWERPMPDGAGTPWLGVLLFAQNELPGDPGAQGLVDTMTVKDLLDHWPHWDQKVSSGVLGSPCHTLTVPAALFQRLAPSSLDLRYLAHVREGRVGVPGVSAAPPGPDGYACVVANRFPGSTAGQYVAHLVSFENTMLKPDAQGTVRLVSLWHWSFATAAEGGRHFGAVAAALRDEGKNKTRHLPTLPGLPAPPLSGTTGDVDSAGVGFDRLRAGYLPLPFHSWSGERTFAWYRGPLTPVPPQPLPTLDGPPSAARLLVYDRRHGIFDASYATAFTVGRTLALADTDFTTSYTRAVTQRRERPPQPKFTGLASPRNTNEPVDKTHTAEDKDKTHTADWFKRLRRLETLPFSYLVPDQRLVPAESVRFSYLDRAWLDALTDGAASVGIGDEADHDAAKKLVEELTAAVKATAPAAAMLIRSELVSRWPALLVSAKDGDGPVHFTRYRAAPQVLLCLFARVPTEVSLGEPHHGWHFGAETGSDDTPGVELRYISSDKVGEPVKEEPLLPFSFREPATDWVLDMSTMVNRLLERLQTKTLSPGQVALQLVASPQVLRFVWGQTP